MGAIWYVRFRGTEYNSRGFQPGLFALVNGLHFDGLLTDDEDAFRRAMNDWYEAHFPNPGIVDPSVYNRDLNPGAAAWFKATAHRFLTPIPRYLRLLEAHATPYEMAITADPGIVLYEDPYQVVARPYRPGEGTSPRGTRGM